MTTWTCTAVAAVARDAVERLLDDSGRPASFTHPADLKTGGSTPLQALQAARLLVSALQRQIVDQALHARGQGEDWPQVATALCLSHDGQPDSAAAYLTVLGVRAGDPWWSPARGVLWTCGVCEEVIRDFGPDCGGPDDREAGHAPTCTRHTSDVVAWEALWR